MLSTRIITKTLSTKLILIVAFATTVLLTAALGVMLYYSRYAVKEEAFQNAEQTLEASIQQIDNILLSVEQATGNMYFNIIPRLDLQPEAMYGFCRELVESNPAITGCAIAFEPYFYQERELFMAYVHRASDNRQGADDAALIESDSFGYRPYTEQAWYTAPIKSGKPTWINTLKGENFDTEPIITFSLPIPGKDGRWVGVLATDISLKLLSHVLYTAKPSPNSHSILIDSDGTFIMHPDSAKILQACMDSPDYHVFRKPFIRAVVPGRSLEHLDWTAGIIYPDSDIFGDWQRLLYLVAAITLAGLVLLMVVGRAFLHKELLPLHRLTLSAQRIAEGDYDEHIPTTSQHNEIGKLQYNFQRMQQSLSNHVKELERLNVTLKERGEGLATAYDQAQKADRMKTTFLHNMTNQMMAPASNIDECVGQLCNRYMEMEPQEADQIVTNVLQQGETIANVLDNMLIMSDDGKRKEADHA